MKKKIETDIHSLATELRDNKAGRSTQEWKELTMQLYEKLCVLEFLENQLDGSYETSSTASKKVENVATPKPTIETKEPVRSKEIEPDIEAIQKDKESLPDKNLGFELDTAKIGRASCRER